MISFSIKNPLIVNLLLAVVAVLGVTSWLSMPQEMFPELELDVVRVTTVFEGAPPIEVERQITTQVEEALDGLADIDTVTSTSREGESQVIVRLKHGVNIDDFIRDANTAIDAIMDLPEDAEETEVARLKARYPVISMSLYGNAAPGYLYSLSEDIKHRLQQIPGVASVGVAGEREWELWVIVDPQVMAARNVSFSLITEALRNNLRDLPGGSLKAVEGDILLRGLGTAISEAEIANIPLRSNAQGGQLVLGQVAQVERRLEETQTLGRFNGAPSVNLTVTKTSEASTIKVAKLVRELADELRQELPSSVEIGLFSDLSTYVKSRLNTVKSSGFIGLTLVLLSLYLFLNFRVAVITAMGIPVSFLVAIIIIHYLGYTINVVSLFAFLIALGLIVDDAIIVTENVYRHMEEGMPAMQAAEQGAREVYWPVIASTTTTVAAFLPMFAIGGQLGVFIAVIPVVVSAALLGSLLEAFLVLPSHSAEMLQVKARSAKASWINWKKWLNRYLSLLTWSLANRYFVLVVTFGILLISLVYAKTRIPFQLFDKVEIGQFFINVEGPGTNSVEDSLQLALRMEKVLQEVVKDDEIDSLLTNVGVSLIDYNRILFGTQYVQLLVDLKKPAARGFVERFVSPLVNFQFNQNGTRTRDTESIINAIRERMQQIPGIQRLSILRPQAGPSGADIEVGVTGPEAAQLLGYTTEIKNYLERLPGAKDVRQDLEPGKLEYQYTLNSRGRELGLTQSEIADAVRIGFLGLEVTHVNWGEDRYPVRVVYSESVRHDSAGLARLPITLDGGGTIYLGEVADIQMTRGLSTLHRRDNQRLATITAEVDDRVATPLEITGLINKQFKDFESAHPGYQLLYLGEKKEASDSITDGTRALVISLSIIFFILAALFKSLLDPLVVMFAIPFGGIGVIVGHSLFGFHLQFLSMVGFLALTGIVVNDSLILIDFAKQLRNKGVDRFEAVIEAARVRIRPILLTSITTFLGISPLIFFASGQTAFLSPMAVSLGFGLMFATALILVALPCFYLIADDSRQFVLEKFRNASRPANVRPG